MTAALQLAPLAPPHAAVLAALHARCFDRAWSADDFAAMLAVPGTAGWLAIAGEAPCGFGLIRVLAGEAELLSLAVEPAHRRRGIGAALLATALASAEAAGAEAVWLEVAVDNAAALALYRRHGFHQTGARAGYYRRADGAVDAAILRRDSTARHADTQAGDPEMSEAILDIARALEFAARQHVDQRRKGADSRPYVNHVIEVGCALARATEGRDPVLMIAGLLHDTIEDTGATPEQVEELFGPEVAALVLEVTDDKSLTKATRKRLQIATAPNKSPSAKRIKLADKTSNLKDLIANPPADWPQRRRVEYVHWACQVAAGCRGIDAGLEAAFDDAVARACEVLGIDPLELTC